MSNVKSEPCCLCLSDDESTFHTNTIMKSLPLHEMVNFCIGIEINDAKNPENHFSTTICNECVLNINNFYTFKKRVLDAQDLINNLSSKKESLNDTSIEYVVDDMMVQVIDSNEESQLVDEEVSNSSEIEASSQRREIPKTTRQIQILKVDKSIQKRSTDSSGSQNAQYTQKKLKAENPTMERFTIQMNECLICPAVLGDILQLKDHIDEHTEINCKACNRQFARYSNLKRHFNSIHSKPKPFQCDICGLDFNFSVNLQAHAALHYNGKIRTE